MGKKNGNRVETRSAAEIKADKIKAFKRVCEPRVNKAVKSIGLVGLCASQNYIYTETEARAITLALQTAVDGVAARFGGEQEAVSGFTLPK